ncbi:protein of unknown function [Taphrina deformans PYCC 5710]|uniref:BZIP domain-containing protein n=1 Tax=Taphrina deformans (strain PYCC 5710 / ATCC 11124 / CBS 356.35 / IMI 108563 / JCM 9778 / NBRC 8474) TaxID=1097556 RepID=R4XDZ3_TAPDE|nr:protein of unknown function [Taphrina deformans PYCC 5710]|eukprot:CCG83877.1 protein of unknown function [Taphrina deformans PYCC 5710]
MELNSYTNTLASDPTLGFDVLANAFLYDNPTTRASPSLSVLSTPRLELLDTPDTVVSHDFDAFSPQVQTHDHFNHFDQDCSIFNDGYPGQGPFFGDTALFPSEEDLTSSALLAKYESTLRPQADAGAEVFVDASALTLAQANEKPLGSQYYASTPASPTSSTKPGFSRSSSGASFAVPKLPRGRKRKTTMIEDQDYVPKKSVGNARKASSVDDEEDDEKVALRAKNTEAAARSRARKRAAMESAERRIRELEEENASLKALIDQKDVLLASHLK